MLSELFPKPLPDETLFSLLCRFHLRAALPSFQHHTLPLLGIRNGRPNAEFPCFVPQFAEMFGFDAKYVVNSFTNLHYYEPFLTQQGYEATVAALATGDTNSLQSRLGSIANRITPGAWLKYCPACVRHDESMYGVAYWHRVHQLIGITVCPLHGCHLHTQRRTKGTVKLPASMNQTEDGTLEECALTRLIADEFSDVARQAKKDNLVPLYLAQLNDYGLLTRGGRIKQKMLHQLLTDRISTLSRQAPVFEFLLTQTQKDYYPECLFYVAHANHHPIKHFMLIYTLFDSWSDFTSRLDHQVANETRKQPNPMECMRTERDWTDALRLLKNGASMRSVADTYSTTVSTLKIKAQQKGIPVDVRPKKIFKAEERAIWRKLFLGAKTETLAIEFNISIAAVEQILSKHPRLKILRARIRYFSDMQRHQSGILSYVKAHRPTTRNEIKRECSASYTWLYKHENAWLYDHVPPEIPRGQRYLH